MVQSIFNKMIEATLTTSAVIATLLLLLPLIRKKYTAKWRYWVWLVLVVRLLFPFNPSILKALIEISPPSQNIEFKLPIQNRTHSPLPDNPTIPPAIKDMSSSRMISFNEILSIVWVLGIIVFMLYHFVG